MAAFNLTAQINLRGPSNLKPTVSKIKRELESVKTNLDININPTSIKTLTSIISKLKALSKSSLDANGNVLTLTSSLNQLASGFNNLSSTTSASVGGINSAAKAVSSINKPLSQATSQIEEFGKQSGLAIRRFAAFSSVTGVIYTLLGAFTSAYSEFIDFNKEMVRLSQVTGKSMGDLKGLSDEITRLSTGLGVSSSDLIKVSATLAQAGLTAEDTKVALEALAKSTLAPSFDNITATTEGAIAAIRQFGIQSGELESALGSINSVAAAFAVESADIITAIQRTGGVFASSSRGVAEGTDALNEFIAVFTSIRATTRESAESIATGLRTIFTRIQRGQTIDALKEFGINLTDLEGKFVGPYEASRRLAAGLKDLDPRDLRFSQIAEELGGFRQIGKVIPLIQQMAVSEEALKIAQKGQTSIAKDTAIAQGSLSNQFNKTRESFVALVRDLGDSSSFKAFVGVSLTLTNSFISLARSLKPLLPLLLTFTAIKMGAGLNQFIGGFRSGLGGGGSAGAGGAGPMGGGPTTGTSGGGATSAAGAISANTIILGTTSQALATLNQSIQTLNTNIIISNGLYQTSGKPSGFARGGVVPGSGSGDTVPAMLEPGEFVIRKKAVQTLGSGNLHKMNKSSGGKIRGYAGGDYVEKQLPGAEEQIKKQSIAYKNIDNLGINPAGKGAIRGYMFEDYVTNKYGLSDPGNNFPDIKNISAETRKSFGLLSHKEIKNVELKYRKGIPITQWDNKDYTKKNTAVLYALNQRLNGGGKIQNLAVGGEISPSLVGVSDNLEKAKAFQAITASDVAKKFLRTRLPNDSAFAQYAGADITNDLIRSAWRKDTKIPNVQSYLLDGMTQDADRIKKGKDQQIAKSYKFGLVGLSPLDYSDTIGPQTLSNTPATIFAKGLPKAYSQSLDNMREGLSGVVHKLATDIQTTGITHGNKEIALDFDETLFGGADLFDKNGAIDIPGYSDLNRVMSGLNNGKITPLGSKIKELINLDPSFLKRLSVLTARPQSNAGLLAAKLNEIGIPIPINKIIGTSGGGSRKADAMTTAQKLIDDNLENIKSIRGRGLEGVAYSPIKGLSENQKKAAGFAGAEGNILEAAMAALGATGGSIQSRAVDYEHGLGATAAQYFPGLNPMWPTEVKRTINGDSISDAKEQFTTWLKAKGMATGGVGSSTDTVPAMLTPGEFVINKKAAQNIGASRLNQMNRADKVQGFARGGSVGGVQRFAGGGGAEMAGAGVIAALVAVILPQMNKLAETFGKLEGSVAVTGAGFDGLAREASSLALSTGIALHTIGGFSDKFKMQAIGGAAIAGGISGAVTDASAKALEQALKQTTESFGKFDKMLSDISNAPTEKLKAEASMRLEKSFFELNSIVKDTSESLDFSENLNSFGKLMGDLSQSILTGIVGFHALKTVMDAQKIAAQATIARATAASLSPQFPIGPTLPVPGMMTTFFAKFGAMVPVIGGLIVGIGALAQVVSFFNSSLKKSTEQMDRLNKALFETTKNSQDVSLANERYVTKVLPAFSKVENDKSKKPEEKAREIGKVGIDNELNLMFRTFLRANLADAGMVTTPDVTMQEMQTTYGGSQRFQTVLQDSIESFKDNQFIAAKRASGMEPDQAQKALVQATKYGRDIVVEEYTGGLSRGVLAQTEATLALRQFKVNLLNLDNVLVGLNARFDNVLTTSLNKFKDLDISLALLKGEPMQTGGDMVRRDIEKLTNLGATPKEDLNKIYKSVGSMMGGADQPIFKDMVDQMEGLRLIQTELPIVLQKINSRPQGQGGDKDLRETLITELGPALAAAIGGKNKGAAKATAETILTEMAAGVNTKLAGTTDSSTIIELIKNSSALNDVLKNAETVQKLFTSALEINAKILDQVGEKNKIFLDLQNNLIQNSIQRKAIEIQTNLEMKKALGNKLSLSDMNETFNSQIKTLTGEGGGIPGGTTDVDTIAAALDTAKKNYTARQTELNAMPFGDKGRGDINTLKNKEELAIKSLTQALNILATSTDTTKNAFEKIAEAQDLFKSRRQVLNDFMKKSQTFEGKAELLKLIDAFQAVNSGKLRPGAEGFAQAQLVIDSQSIIQALTGDANIADRAALRAQKLQVGGMQTNGINGKLLQIMTGIFLDSKGGIGGLTKKIEEDKKKMKNAGTQVDKPIKESLTLVTNSTVDIFASFNKQMQEQLTNAVNNVKMIGDRVGPASPTLQTDGMSVMALNKKILDLINQLNEARSISNLPAFVGPQGFGAAPAMGSYGRPDPERIFGLPLIAQIEALTKEIQNLKDQGRDTTSFDKALNEIKNPAQKTIPKFTPNANGSTDQSFIPAATTDKLATIYKTHDENTNLLVTSMNSFTTAVPNLIASLKEFAVKFEKGMKGTVTTTGEMSINFNNSLDLRGAPTDISPKALLLIQSVVKDEVKRGLGALS